MFDRLIKIINDEKFNTLRNIKVLIIGIGGVGGYALESLVRSGVEDITIVDGDVVDITNLNRQIIAKQSTISKVKVEVAETRAKDINPNINIKAINKFIDKDNIEKIFENKYNYIIDACDTITTKVLLIKYAEEKKIKIISCMGTGNRLDPSKLVITTLNKTNNDPLAKVMRKLLKENNLNPKIPVVWSSELPIKIDSRTPGSCVTVPMAAGALLATFIIRDIYNK